MLKKNIYILYPAGYMGTYLNWSLCKSDADEAMNTVDDPVNKVKSKVHGGNGTAHLHVKIPTHHPPWMHYAWYMYNKPTTPNIYNINCISTGSHLGADAYKFITNIIASDPDPVFIVIHDGNERDVIKFGAINALLKWPTQGKIQMNDDFYKDIPNFDPFDCATDRNLRNYVGKTLLGKFVKTNAPFDASKLEQALEYYGYWYRVRHELQPQEINLDTYLPPVTKPISELMGTQFFDIHCCDIVSDKFPDILTNILEKSGASDKFDTSYVRGFHHNYVNAQKTMEWFQSIVHWRKTGELTEYLKSHAYIEGFVLNEIFFNCPELKDSMDWENMSLEDINTIFQMGRQTK